MKHSYWTFDEDCITRDSCVHHCACDVFSDNKLCKRFTDQLVMVFVNCNNCQRYTL